MNTKSKDKPRPPIIARVSNYNAQRKLYKARLNLRKSDLKDVGAVKIFINENLTAWRAELFKEARKVKKNITMVGHGLLMVTFFENRKKYRGLIPTKI